MSQEIRFAALIRVSTEKQEKQGESLRTQKSQIEEAVQSLGGIIAKEYGGQEHATPGWEKKQLDNLLRDASKEKPPFDAVIVADPSRWSRDNEKSKQGLRIFREHGVKFFALTQEFDLYDPNAILFLGMAAEIGEFQARTQKQKAIQSKIHRAKRLNAPTQGKVPFGRIYDKETNTWSVDKQKKAMIQDVARRYVAGESMSSLADEYGMNHSFLQKVVCYKSGTEHIIHFDVPDLKIKEDVIITVPELLSPAMIAKVRERVEANTTYHHGQRKHPYLLGRMIFCDHCGHALAGCSNGTKTPTGYYRHNTRKAKKPCPHQKKYVRADLIEGNVISRLFGMFGNVDLLITAMKDAVPDLEEIQKANVQEDRLREEIAEIAEARDRIINLVAKDALTEKQAEKKLLELKDKQKRLEKQLDQLLARLEDAPTSQKIQEMAEYVKTMFAKDHAAVAEDFDTMTWEQKRALCQIVFSGKRPDGSRMGVYVHWPEDRETWENDPKWDYSIHGHLISTPWFYPNELYSNGPLFAGYKTLELLEDRDVDLDVLYHDHR